MRKYRSNLTGFNNLMDKGGDYETSILKGRNSFEVLEGLSQEKE